MKTRKCNRAFALLCTMALVLTLFTGFVPASAAEVTVEQWIEGVSWKFKTFVKSYTVGDGVTLDVELQYPYFKVEGDKTMTKTINKAVKKAMVTNIVNEYKELARDHEAGTVISVTSENIEHYDNWSARTGNLLGLSFYILDYVEGGAYPHNTYTELNLDLRTGKVLTTKSFFEKRTALRKAVSNYLFKQMQQQNKDEKKMNPDGYSEYEIFFTDKGAKSALKKILKNEWQLSDCRFNYDGMYITFDESQHGFHALGAQELSVPYSVFGEYIKEEYSQLLLPLSMVVYDLPAYSTGTGYSWNGGEETDGDPLLELVFCGTREEYHPLGMTGYEATDYVVYRSLGKAGTTTLEYKLTRLWEPDGEPADTFKVDVLVTEDGFVTEINGEG